MNKKVDKKLTMQVRVEMGLHTLLKILAAEQKTTIKTLIEGLIIDYLGNKIEYGRNKRK